MFSISRKFITPVFRRLSRTCSPWRDLHLSTKRIQPRDVMRMFDLPQASFFWSKSPSKAAQDDTAAQATQKEGRITEEDLNNPSQWDSLGFLMDQFKAEQRQKKPLIPPQDPKYHGKLTVVIEMDEILFYTFVPDEHEAYINAPLKDHDYYFELQEYDTYLSVYKRPHLEEFLKYLREHTEPILFTKGVKAYAEKVLVTKKPRISYQLFIEKKMYTPKALVDPEKTFVHVLTNEDCGKIVYPPEDMDEYVKDVENLGRDMKKLVYVDSQPVSFWTAPNNGNNQFSAMITSMISSQALPTSSYYAELHDEDKQLLDLIEELKFLETQDDVRTILTEEFKVRETLKASRFL